MRAGLGTRTDRAPAPAIVATLAMKLRQLAQAAQSQGLPIELTLEAIAALHAAMNKRGLSSYTKRATTSALARFAQYVAAPDEVRDALRRVTAMHDAATRQETKRKERVLQNVDVSAETVLAKAQQLLDEASSLTNPRFALTRRNEAYCLAFFTLLPLRLNDTRLTFGEELTWDGTVWQLKLTTRKTGFDYACRLDPFLTPFINALVLQGLDLAYLDARRAACVAQKRPALVTVQCQGVGYNYVSDIWRKYFGIGEHVTRTQMHETFAEQRGTAGTELALQACGQHSAQSASHYHGRRIRTARLAQMQGGMEALARDLPDGLFAV